MSMLEYFFEFSTQRERLRCRPLSEHIDGLAGKLLRLGFTRGSGQQILSMAGKFNDFAFLKGIVSADRIDEALVDRFIKVELASYGTFKNASSKMRHVLEYLREQGVIPKSITSGLDDPFVAILAPYDCHLRDVRGLTLVSRSQYLRYARRLLVWLQNHRPGRPLAGTTGVDILEFVSGLAGLHRSGSWRNNLCSLTRVFLRYLRWQGIIEIDLDRVVPKLPRWRLSSLPRHLPWDQVQKLIGSIDASDAVGMRDKAALLLIATLGLRNQEACRLQISDISWRTAEIRVTETKTRRARSLPLPQEVGEAIADYILKGRPRLDLPYVFLHHRAPQGPLTTSHGIGNIVRKHLLRTGISTPSHGAHLLRHSLATRMVNQGVPIKGIADVLGHASIDTTAIYTKVNMTNLASVALPFPGGAQ